MLNNNQHEEIFKQQLFADGYLITSPWATGTTEAGFMKERKSVGVSYVIRKCISREIYITPDDRWQQVWGAIRDRMQCIGEYRRPEAAIEAWLRTRKGDSIEESIGFDAWPTLSNRILAGNPTMWLIAVRTSETSENGFPGVTLVAETPDGGSAGAEMIVHFARKWGVGGVLARQENRDRWGVVKLIYTPTWYSQSGDICLGIDWERWANGPKDDNESKRIWCEQMALLIHRMKKEFSSLLDSIFFDEYLGSDNFGDLSSVDRKRICNLPADKLAEHFSAMQSDN